MTIKKYKAGTKELIWESGPIKNLVVSGSGGYGRNLIMRQLAGDTTYPIEIDSAAIGSGTDAPADSDTGLQTAVVSGVSVSTSTATNDVLTIDVFMSDTTLPDGTYSEFGLFCNLRLFARILISPSYTKDPGEDTIFTYTLTATG